MALAYSPWTSVLAVFRVALAWYWELISMAFCRSAFWAAPISSALAPDAFRARRSFAACWNSSAAFCPAACSAR